VPESQSASSSLDVLLQTFTIMGQRLNFYELKEADVVIQPNLIGIKGTDFGSRNTSILAGERAAAEMMPEIRKKIAAMSLK
jgi:NTE family protein